MIICSPQLGLSPESNSGGEVYDREIIKRLCQKGVKILTLLPKDRPYLVHKNLAVEYAPVKTMFPPHVFSAFALPYLIKTYQKQKFDILRIHNPYFLGPAALVFKKLYPKVPIVGSFLHLEKQRVFGSFDHIITISRSTKNEIIEQLRYPSEKITVAYPGVDQRFIPHHKNGAGFVIMFVGGLKKRKNPEFLLKVLAKINRPEVKLVFAGDGPLKNKLKGKNVKVTGYVPEKGKPELYHQADVVVLPSLKEGFGMTLIEAGASGVPTVGANHYSISEIIVDGRTGFLAKPNDADDWARKLIQLIKDKNLRLKMGRAAAAHVRKKFTWEKNINTQIQVYRKLLQGRTLTESMRILFVNEYSRPVSGAEFSQNELAQAVKAECYSPKWFRSGLGRGASPLLFNNPLYYLYSAWKIYQKNFDLIHVHGKYILPGAVIAGWLTGKPVIATVRDFKFLCPLALCFTNQRLSCSLSYFIKKEIPQYQSRYATVGKWRLVLAKLWQYQLKWWLNRCRKVICVSPQLAKIYQANGIKNIDRIYNLPPEKQSASRGELVLSVGKLSYGKGTDSIIAAAKLLSQYQFIFAGEINPSFKADFPENCRYLGRIDHRRAMRFYSQAGVFVINSRWPEPLSRAGLEALSFGLPIVASNRGGNLELVKGNGFLVDPEQPKTIAAAIKKALKNREIFGRNSYKLLTSRFNRRQIITAHLNLYRSLCSKS